MGNLKVSKVAEFITLKFSLLSGTYIEYWSLMIILKWYTKKLLENSQQFRKCRILSHKKNDKFQFEIFLNLTLITAQLIWMFCRRTLNHRIDKLHERALRIAYWDYASNFEELLKRDGTLTMHQRNFRTLVIENWLNKKNY